MIKKCLSVLCVTTSLFASFDIYTTWQQVQTHNEGLKAFQADVYGAMQKKDSAKSMYLPSISLTGSYTHMDKPIDLDTSDIASILSLFKIPFPSSIDLSKKDIFLADLQLLWPLYTGGKIDAAQDIYAAKLDETKAQLQMKRDKEFLTLIKLYYGSVVTESLYKTRQEAQKALNLHYENAKKLKAEGQIANIELLNAKVKLDAAKIETTKAKHNHEIVLSALQRLTGNATVPSNRLFMTKIYGDEQSYKEATCNYNALKVFDTKEKQAAALIKIKKADFYPSVVGFGDYNIYRDDTLLMKSMPNWFAGVVVQFNLLQRTDRSQEIRIAKATRDKVRFLKAEALENLKTLSEKTYKEMVASSEEFYALDSSLALAQENFKLRQLSFKEGLATSSDVVDARLFLQSIQTKRLNAAYTFVQKFAQLFVLTGKREDFFKALQEVSPLQ